MVYVPVGQLLSVTLFKWYTGHRDSNVTWNSKDLCGFSTSNHKRSSGEFSKFRRDTVDMFIRYAMLSDVISKFALALFLVLEVSEISATISIQLSWLYSSM